MVVCGVCCVLCVAAILFWLNCKSVYSYWQNEKKQLNVEVRTISDLEGVWQAFCVCVCVCVGAAGDGGSDGEDQPTQPSTVH